jgi:phosphoribosylformylglycinamidine synthase
VTSPAALEGAARAGIAPRDYDEVCRRIGREPNPIEASMFGVMWSEHCGYKHSRRALRRLPMRSSRVVSAPGENAGVVAVDDEWALAFKMESHNHPSAVDPYNGAATGVGGIIRDILAMGARPVALLDSLRFGAPSEARSRRVMAGVVAGIAGYGNAIGVPTVGGELRTDACYGENPLVNVACLGLVPRDKIMTAAAGGVGNVVLYVGARTGRDGIGGAAFASTELDEAREREDRASVQIGDPFTGKLLIEATLAAIEGGGVVAIQDMGAAGLTCATSEMAARGGVGMRVDLDRVPLREPAMRPHEILLSESQERMLLVVRPDAADRIADVYRRWGLAARTIGIVTDDQRLRVAWHGDVIVDLPPDALADAPVYDPAAEPPAKALPANRATVDGALDPEATLLALLRHPDVASKRAVFEQYDHMVGIRTAVVPGGDAAVIRLLEASPKGIAITSDGNGRWCATDPLRGAAWCVLEAAANLACVGAEPVAVTDCLNYGSPERPDVFWTFREGIQGIAQACEALDVPVVGGNVSFYNEAQAPSGTALAARAIHPTPIVGMAGIVPDVARVIGAGFAREGDLICVVGGESAALDGSLLAALDGIDPSGTLTDDGLEAAARAIQCVRLCVRSGVLRSAHDCSDGGLAVALAEACVLGGRGATVSIEPSAAAWFGEAPARFVVSLDPDRWSDLAWSAATHGVVAQAIGTVGGDTLRIAPRDAGASEMQIHVEVRALNDARESLEV